MTANIAIIDSEAISAAGNVAQLWGNVDLELSVPNPDPILRYCVAGTAGHIVPFTHPIANAHETSYGWRVAELFVDPLEKLCQRHLPLAKKCLCIIMLPSADSIQAKMGLTQAWIRSIAMEKANLPTELTLEFHDQGKGGLHSLARARQALTEDNAYDAVIWGGIDSFIDSEIIGHLVQAGEIESNKDVQSPAAGEGSAWLWLEKASLDNHAPILSASTVSDSENLPYHQLIDNLCLQKHCKIDDLTSWVFAQPRSLQEKRHWKKVCQAHWQQPVNSLPISDRIQQVKLADVLGNLGVSALPLGIVYGIGRLAHQMQVLENVVVVEQEPVLGGVLMSR